MRLALIVLFLVSVAALLVGWAGLGVALYTIRWVTGTAGASTSAPAVADINGSCIPATRLYANGSSASTRTGRR